MRAYVAVMERCPATGFYVGWCPELPGAHAQGETLDELHANLQDVIEMLLEDGFCGSSSPAGFPGNDG